MHFGQTTSVKRAYDVLSTLRPMPKPPLWPHRYTLLRKTARKKLPRRCRCKKVPVLLTEGYNYFWSTIWSETEYRNAFPFLQTCQRND